MDLLVELVDESTKNHRGGRDELIHRGTDFDGIGATNRIS
jgi:hypothetical protein